MLTNVKVIQDDEPTAKEPVIHVPTAEEIARDFGMEDCDDFMTALKDTMGEDDYD